MLNTKPHPPAERVNKIKTSPTLAVATRAEELLLAGKPIINLSVGEPDFDTPLHIKEAAIKAIKDGFTKYTPVDGIKSLKQAIVDKFLRENNLSFALNNILVSCGAKHTLYNFLAAFLNPGDEVIIPAPYWVSYPDMVILNGGIPVIAATPEPHYKLTPDGLTESINEKTRVLILNSPSNPTGMCYSPAELKALAQVLIKHPNIFIVCDDIYEHNLWNHLPFKNILNICPELSSRCLIVNGVSKSYAMTGWRIGYAGGPAGIISAMKKVQSQSTSNPCSIAQYAALAALEGDQSFIDQVNKAYRERHDYLVNALQSFPKIKVTPSDGTFYTFPSVENYLSPQSDLSNDIAFAEALLTEANIAVVPGSAFGAPGKIRLSYATSLNNIKQAVENLTLFLKN